MQHKSPVILDIDTSHSEATFVRLIIDGRAFEKVSDARLAKSQIVLQFIEQILQEQHVRLVDIGEIQVNEGPGSFTGLRVGLAVAQMLGKLLNIPVNGKPAGEVQLVYEDSKWE